MGSTRVVLSDAAVCDPRTRNSVRGSEMKHPLSPSEAFCDEKELAVELALAVATLRNWRSKEEGPAYVKIGKRCVRYPRSAIDAFIAAGFRVHGGGK